MILVLEDSPNILELYETQASVFDLPVVTACDIPQAEALYHKHKEELKAIIFDGKINGVVQPTCDLVSRIRPEFPGMMLAAALSPDTNERLVAAGCNLAAKDKHTVIETVADLLRKQNG